ncbi:golgin subfamily A member 3-like isoform X2 [Nematostella vectensis]|uniref:golgin subfamily A member 3-like isoform X2 n=1 Tax=Nematostella vectensis TaxID=45351 RepID=UPI0020772F9F|nr:golgin subfamily A member 3-like isoform X2 [Nematostella vectensis]
MERFINSIRTALSDSYTEVTSPYYNSHENTQGYDTELNYTFPPTPPHHTDKPLTRLSANPSQLEKTLRTIVLDLYSEAEPDKQPKLSTESPAVQSDFGVSLSSTLSSDVIDVMEKEQTRDHYKTTGSNISSLEAYVKAPCLSGLTGVQGSGIGGTYIGGTSAGYQGYGAEGTYIGGTSAGFQGRGAEGTYVGGTSAGFQGRGAEGTYVGGTSAGFQGRGAEGTYIGGTSAGAQGQGTKENSSEDSSRIQTVQELRGCLERLQFTDITDPQLNISFSESDTVATPTFDDSGVHLEFVTSDQEMSDSEPDGVGHVASVSRGEDRINQSVTIDKEVGRTICSDNPKSPIGLENENGFQFQEQQLPTKTDDKQPSTQASSEMVNPSHVSVSFFGSPVDGKSYDVTTQGESQGSLAVLQGLGSVYSADDSNGDSQHRQLIFERANLEGKLEALTGEYNSILAERKELHAQLRTLQARLQETVANARITESCIDEVKDTNDSRNDFLHEEIAELQESLNAKELRLNEAQERLKFSTTNVQRLEETIANYESGMRTKDVNITELETQLGNMRKSLEQSRQHQQRFVQGEQELNADVSSLLNAKAWYQRQLEIAKESRVKLQLEVSEYESTIASQNKMVEQLKCENARTSKQLLETQQRTLEEKTRILKHLENVEEDMMRHEAAFKQFQLEKQSVERGLCGKIEEMRAENEHLRSLSGSTKDLETEIEALRRDTCLKEAEVADLQSEKDEVLKQLKVARGVNEINNKKLSALEQKLLSKNEELRGMEDKGQISAGEIKRLQSEKRELEMQLKEAEDERTAFDGAVQMLKLELEKVERRFKFMKRELLTKTQQLEEVSEQKNNLLHEMGVVRTEIADHVTILEDLRITLQERNGTIEGLKADRLRLEEELRALSDRLRCAQTSCAVAEQERSELHEQLQTTTSQVSELKEQVHSSQREKARLEGELESTVRSKSDELNASRAQASALQHELAELQRSLQRELTRHRDDTISLEQQVEFYKRQAGRHE